MKKSIEGKINKDNRKGTSKRTKENGAHMTHDRGEKEKLKQREKRASQ